MDEGDDDDDGGGSVADKLINFSKGCDTGDENAEYCSDDEEEGEQYIIIIN